MSKKQNTYNSNEEYDEEGQSGVATREKLKLERPKKYNVLLHNDDYTTMEFVVYILKKHFKKTQAMAEDIMLEIHHQGHGVAGTFGFEVAETKVAIVKREAKENGHPLMCTMEPED